MINLLSNKIRFDRNEFSGSFGDIGTDLPLIVGLILVGGLDTSSVLIMFGVMQIFTGFFYGLPMPVQPLKAMAVIVISTKLTGNIVYGAGFAIGITMLVLTLTGGLEWLVRIIPKSVIRGVQFALGISLIIIAMRNYVISGAIQEYMLAFLGFTLTLLFIGNRKFPPALFLIPLGVVYALIFNMNFMTLGGGIGLTLPKTNIPNIQDIIQGFVLLVIPQIGLSISNSIVATKQTINDLFPDKRINVKKIGLTYSLMNIINPFFGGIPTCHGAGGLAGHHTFGARTGGSVVIYGSIFLILGLFFANGFSEIIKIFPLPILGIILIFEGLILMSFIRDIAEEKMDIFVSLLVVLVAITLSNGYVIGLIVGTVIAFMVKSIFPYKRKNEIALSTA